jgi:hypothetical protein
LRPIEQNQRIAGKLKPAPGSSARRRPTAARGDGARLVPVGPLGGFVEPGGLQADMRPGWIDVAQRQRPPDDPADPAERRILGFSDRLGAPSAQRALRDPMPADFPLGCADADGDAGAAGSGMAGLLPGGECWDHSRSFGISQ